MELYETNCRRTVPPPFYLSLAPAEDRINSVSPPIATGSPPEPNFALRKIFDRTANAAKGSSLLFG